MVTILGGAEVVRRPLTEPKTRDALFLQGNCVQWRDAAVATLMEHVQVPGRPAPAPRRAAARPGRAAE